MHRTSAIAVCSPRPHRAAATCLWHEVCKAAISYMHLLLTSGHSVVRADLDLTVFLGGGLKVGPGLGGVCQLVAPHGPADAAQLVVHLCQLTVRDEHRLTLRAAQRCLKLLLCQLQIQATVTSAGQKQLS